LKNKKTLIIVTLIGLIVGFFFATSIYKRKQEKDDSKRSVKYSEVFIRKHSPSKGPAKAPVFLVEFMDPECESCRAFHPMVKKVMAQYPKKVRLILRYTPFHKNSKFMIKILEASRRQHKFWEVLDLVFKTQHLWGSHKNPQPELIWKYLPNVSGLNIEQIKKDIKDPSIDKLIQQDIDDGKRLNVRQTPTFFVNGKRLKRLGYEILKRVIEHELKL
jgi:protein-disulfide isomerase